MYYNNIDPEQRGHAIKQIKELFVSDLGSEILYESDEVTVY